MIEDLEEFEFDGAKIYVKLDFARKNGDRIEIFDWKTGKTDKEARVQMGAYAIYAMKKWGIPLESIRGLIVNLSAHPVVPQPHPMDQALIDETMTFIKHSVKQMQGLLSDVQKNSPKEMIHFKFTENIRSCDYCNFLKICDRVNVKI